MWHQARALATGRKLTALVADNGTYTPRWDGTVADVLDAYLKSASFEHEANTVPLVHRATGTHR